jgi:hypothetical protein
MSVLDSPDCYGDTIFCDDIRHENGGKTSYIGVYRGNLFTLAEFPITLPIFGFGILYNQRKKVFVPPSRISIFLPGESEDGPAGIMTEVDPNWLKQAKDAAKNFEADDLISLVAHIQIASLVLKQPGQIRVRVDRGEDLFRLGALKIDYHPEFLAKRASGNTQRS